MQTKLNHQALDQYEILVDGKRVGYICRGDEKPINWLPAKAIRAEVTVDERIAISKEVRKQMGKINAEHNAKTQELEQLESGVEPAPSKPEPKAK